MATGTIASLRDKGFGFISRDGQRSQSDLFFHRSGVANDGFERLAEGQQVNFDEEPDPRDASRQRAINVRAVEAVAMANDE